MISQASHGMVHECCLEEFLKANIIAEQYEITCSDEQFLEFLIFNKKHLGAKYSRLQIVGLALVKLFHIKQWFKNGDEEFICSEWSARVCQILNEPMPSDLDSFTPSDLREQLRKLQVKQIL